MHLISVKLTCEHLKRFTQCYPIKRISKEIGKILSHKALKVNLQGRSIIIQETVWEFSPDNLCI